MAIKRAFIEYKNGCLRCGVGALSKIIGISKTIITQWVKDGLPYTTRTSSNKERVFDLDEVRKWMADNDIDIDAVLDREKTKAHTEDIRIRTEERKQKMAIRDKEYIPITEVSNNIKEMVLYLKNQDTLFMKREPDAKLRKKIDAHMKKKWDSMHNEMESKL